MAAWPNQLSPHQAKLPSSILGPAIWTERGQENTDAGRREDTPGTVLGG